MDIDKIDFRKVNVRDDLSGIQYRHLKAIKPVGRKIGKNLATVYLCKCDCGNDFYTISSSLKNGRAKSCGCESNTMRSEANSIHGKYKSGTYSSWLAMKARCNNINNVGYKDYGARGIGICEEWENSFEAFLKYMGERPFKAAQIDRIENNDGYHPGNCQWSTPKQNARNTRANHIIKYQGRSMCISAWAEAYEIRFGLLHQRIGRGWDIGRALNTPVQKRKAG